MKMIFTMLSCLLLGGCVSMATPDLGISEKAWLRRTLVADLAVKEPGLTVYRSGGTFYYFREGVLIKIDQGQGMPHTLNVNLLTN